MKIPQDIRRAGSRHHIVGDINATMTPIIRETDPISLVMIMGTKKSKIIFAYILTPFF